MGDATPNPADLRELGNALRQATRHLADAESAAARISKETPRTCVLCGMGSKLLCDMCVEKVADDVICDQWSDRCTQRMASRHGTCGKPAFGPFNLCDRHYEQAVTQSQFHFRDPYDGSLAPSVAAPLLHAMSNDMVERECERRGLRRPIVRVTEPEPTPAPARVSYVYACTHGDPGRGDPVKVGISVDPLGRMKALGHARLLGVEFGGREREAELHARFADHRQVGEWFQPDPMVMEWVATLSDPAELIGEAA